MNRIRRWRLLRAYRRLAKLEAHLGLKDDAVAGARFVFAAETMKMIDRGLIFKSVPRQQRRGLQRSLAKGQSRA